MDIAMKRGLMRSLFEERCRCGINGLLVEPYRHGISSLPGEAYRHGMNRVCAAALMLCGSILLTGCHGSEGMRS